MWLVLRSAAFALCATAAAAAAPLATSSSTAEHAHALLATLAAESCHHGPGTCPNFCERKATGHRSAKSSKGNAAAMGWELMCSSPHCCACSACAARAALAGDCSGVPA